MRRCRSQASLVVTTPSRGDVAPQPGHLRRREVRIEREPGRARQVIGLAGHVGTDRRGPAVLPGDGRAQGAARAAIPGQDGLALIGEPDGRDACARPGDGLPSGLADRFPQLLGVLFDAAARNRLRRHGGLDGGHDLAVLAEDDRLGGRGPLVDGEDPHRARSLSGIGWLHFPAPWAAFPAPSAHPDRREGAPDGSAATIPVTRRRGLLSCPQHPLLSRPKGRPTKGDARA